MRDTQELRLNQIVRYTDPKGRVYDGAIIRDIDRKDNHVLLSYTQTTTRWVDASTITVPR